MPMYEKLGFVMFFFALLIAFPVGIYFIGRKYGERREKERQREKSTNFYRTVPAENYGQVIDRQRAIATAFEIERRRIERDLHDGVQQYLVATTMDIGEALLILEGKDAQVAQQDIDDVRERLHSAQQRAALALKELRKTVAGIHPKVLSDLGLKVAVEDLAISFPLEVRVHVPYDLPVIPEGVVAAGYFTIAEALTNVAKYAPEATVDILISVDDNLRLSIVDSGPGGAKMREGGGLAGIRERLEAFGGTCSLSSPAGGPTVVCASIPLMLHRGEFGSSFAVERT
ncbi:sensor histidine kinase [Actinotignum urinale]|nr:histidine kinase [Actinotignum urinale]